ncbi:hypothetical protein RGQ29_031556 [Quercus rubra]|uniref:Uncharacterized protein n=1 Tax=Quercus rubra TaxID=3512 RepID=A0AAN7EKZ1_QUERU|nr:hypothetical protein RGQ29_031556 [Quercus rubra]
MNCIQKGLIPLKYYEKSSERLTQANGEKLIINYKIPNFLIRVDCKSAKEVLQKDVQNLISKQSFARWQAILIRQLIPPGWEHPKTEIFKTQTFYEHILVDTDSILVTHMPCSQEPNIIGYSKMVPQFYNYYDYMEAWDRFLLFQNNIYRHTWFFWFDMYRKKDMMIPRWFIDWWNSYGPEAMILPPDLLKAYETFKKEPPNIPHLRDFPHLLQFFYKFPDLPWIIRWEYKIEKNPQYPFPMLTRKFKLKWWNKFNFDHICQEFQKKTSSSQTESSNFFLEKSQVQCQLASVSDRKQLKMQLLEAASQISDEDDTVMESSSPNYRTHLEVFQDSQDPYYM